MQEHGDKLKFNTLTLNFKTMDFQTLFNDARNVSDAREKTAKELKSRFVNEILPTYVEILKNTGFDFSCFETKKAVVANQKKLDDIFDCGHYFYMQIEKSGTVSEAISGIFHNGEIEHTYEEVEIKANGANLSFYGLLELIPLMAQRAAQLIEKEKKNIEKGSNILGLKK